MQLNRLTKVFKSVARSLISENSANIKPMVGLIEVYMS